MPRYDYILFDADHTLFDFDRAEREALHRVLRRRGYPLEAAEERYLALNRDLWARFDRGEIRREVLIVERFARLAREFGRTDDPEELNLEYLTCLGEGAYLLPGAEALCRTLAESCTLAIVTNGVALAQRGRFRRSPLRDIIPWLFISEEIGASKPDPAFFRAVFGVLGLEDLRRVLMVGDNLLADVKGGLDAGVDAVWYNPRRLPPQGEIVPTYDLGGFQELEALILG